MSVIQFENVGMRYGTGPEILQDISFIVPSGSFRFIAGASGAGKSTLLRMLYLANQPSRGLINLFGHEVSSLTRDERARLRRRIGVVFQDFRLINHLTTEENVALPLKIGGASDAQIGDHVRDLLRWVGLGDKLNARPSTLSGGEQQRVAIARAVISKPDLLLADEPTGNVDDQIGLRLMRLFDELNKLGTTVIVATHNEAMIRRFDYPVMRLQDGRLFHAPRVGRSA